jgi:hypothetical protein
MTVRFIVHDDLGRLLCGSASRTQSGTRMKEVVMAS